MKNMIRPRKRADSEDCGSSFAKVTARKANTNGAVTVTYEDGHDAILFADAADALHQDPAYSGKVVMLNEPLEMAGIHPHYDADARAAPRARIAAGGSPEKCAAAAARELWSAVHGGPIYDGANARPRIE